MKDNILKMFESAYRDRSPLFGTIPTECVVMLSKILPLGARIADLGCGDGRDSLFLLEHGFKIQAIDLCNSAIAALIKVAIARGFDTQLETLVGSVTDWNPNPSSFDAVIGITILDHLEFKDHNLVIQSITTALRPGGLLVLEMHSDRDPGFCGESNSSSEFVKAIRSVSTSNYLLTKFLAGWRILAYSDREEKDLDHGDPHDHGFVTIIAKKEVNL